MKEGMAGKEGRVRSATIGCRYRACLRFGIGRNRGRMKVGRAQPGSIGALANPRIRESTICAIAAGGLPGPPPVAFVHI
jgi:hypothetical protein